MSYTIKVNDYETGCNRIIDDALEEVTISGMAGTGKTSRVPTGLGNRGKKVFVVIPTSVGVHAAFNYIKNTNSISVKPQVRENLGWSANSKMRYRNSKIESARNFLYGGDILDPARDSSIVYCTPGHMKKVLRDLIKYIDKCGIHTDVDFCDYLIVDEAHSQSSDITFIIAYWRYIRSCFPDVKVPALIKMSATIEEEGVVIQYEEPEKRFFVNVDYLDNMGDMVPSELRQSRPNPRKIIEFLPTVIHQYIGSFVRRGRKDRSYPTDGVALVFLPGISDIRSVDKRLTGLMESSNYGRFEILYAHSSQNEENMDRIMGEKPREIAWRIILSTNICETTVTIKNVNFVFDSTLSREPFEGSNGTVFLRTDFVSMPSLEQRAGRTGRQCDGTVFRCCMKSDCDSKLFDKRKLPEVVRLPITTDIMKSLDANIDVRNLLPQVSPFKFSRIYEELTELCCLLKNRSFYTVTDVGKFVSDIPLSVRNAALLYNWLKRSRDALPGIVLAVMIESVESIFTGDVTDKIFSPYPLGTIMNPIIKLWEKTKRPQPSIRDIRKFATEHGISSDGLTEAFRKIFEIIRILTVKGHEIEFFMFDVRNLFNVAISCIKRCYPKLKARGTKIFTNPNAKEHKVYIMSEKFLKVGHLDPNEIYALTITQRFGGSDMMVAVWVPPEPLESVPEEPSDELEDSNEEETSDVEKASGSQSSDHDDEEYSSGDDHDYNDGVRDNGDDEEELVKPTTSRNHKGDDEKEDFL